jgi:hypothetical protein
MRKSPRMSLSFTLLSKEIIEELQLELGHVFKSLTLIKRAKVETHTPATMK